MIRDGKWCGHHVFDRVRRVLRWACISAISHVCLARSLICEPDFRNTHKAPSALPFIPSGWCLNAWPCAKVWYQARPYRRCDGGNWLCSTLRTRYDVYIHHHLAIWRFAAMHACMGQAGAAIYADTNSNHDLLPQTYISRVWESPLVTRTTTSRYGCLMPV